MLARTLQSYYVMSNTESNISSKRFFVRQLAFFPKKNVDSSSMFPGVCNVTYVIME